MNTLKRARSRGPAPAVRGGSHFSPRRTSSTHFVQERKTSGLAFPIRTVPLKCIGPYAQTDVGHRTVHDSNNLA